MFISKLRWSILTLAFVVLLWGAYGGLRLGGYLPCFSCFYVKGRCGTCFLWTLQQNIGAFNFASLISLAGQLAVFSSLVVIVGKAWCGWLCPLGFIQDLMDAVRQKLGIGHVRFSEKLRNLLKSLKWIFLAVAVLLPLWVAFPVFFPSVAVDLYLPFCQICPGKYILPLLNGNPQYVVVDFKSTTLLVMSIIGLLLSATVIVGSAVKRRFWCAYCPMGLMLSWFRKAGLLKLKKNNEKCTQCEICYNVCPMEIEDVFAEREKNDVTFADCTLCLKCIELCPEEDALRADYVGKTIYRSTNEGFFKKHLSLSKQG